MYLQTMWTALLFVAAFIFRQGFALYFIQPKVYLTTRHLVKPNETVYSAKATLHPDESPPVIYSLSFTDVHCSSLDIRPDTGTVFLKPDHEFYQDTRTCEYTIRAALNGRPGLRGMNESHMLLVINKLKRMPEKIDCSSLSKKELCFGDATEFVIHVMENSMEMNVAGLGIKACAPLQLDYVVTVDEDILFVQESSEDLTSFELRVEKNLDRETRDSFNFIIRCSFSSEKTEMVDVELNGTLVVLDEDDNPPMTQTAYQHQRVYISLLPKDNKYVAGSQIFATKTAQLLAVDKDTVGVNSFEITLLNDTKKLLVVNHLVLNSSHLKVPGTVVYLKTYLADKLVGGSWPGLYCVTVNVHDTTLASRHGNPYMTFEVCLHWDDVDYEAIVTKPRLSLAEVETIWKTRIFKETFTRKASSKTVALYPFKELIQDISEMSSYPAFHFMLEYFHTYNKQHEDTTKKYLSTVEHTGAAPFYVSPKMGIIYTNDSHFVKNIEIHEVVLGIVANISFVSNNTGNSTNYTFRGNVSIYLDEEVDWKADPECEHVSCAEFAEPDKCTSLCGFGAHGFCKWDQPINNSIDDVQLENNGDITRKFSTCTALPQTCPDTNCDEIEKMFPLLCPQDCVGNIMGFGHLNVRVNGMKYGIESGIGVCSCHGSSTCSCLPPSGLSYTDTKDESSELENESQSTCDQNCVFFLSAAGLFCLLTLFCGSYLWRVGALHRKKHPRPVKRALISTGSHSEENSANGILPSIDYLGPEIRHPFPVGSNLSYESYVPVDSKWEIARSELDLQQILGEGEFGRVLKGRVHDCDGYEKHSAVAVKMLKEHVTESGKSSRQEFMAEFSLLKQVDHPNVVKLIGACTTPGGPPYLILEYAEFGSLRGFLRKCRRVESLLGSGSPLNIRREFNSGDALDFDPEKYVVTPNEILGFSWQIAKGMVYLSDMKMVHRDLAARNILLTEDRVCKISDFGLTRDIYVDDAYKKKSKDRVPFKWLAPECLEDEFYTCKSDVWAYGILLWELTTLGASPYPGIQTEHLYGLLKTGYRMEQPINCSPELYGLMRQCWLSDPQLRPSFRQLEASLSKLLEDGIEYLRLDIPTVSNPGYDYFS